MLTRRHLLTAAGALPLLMGLGVLAQAKYPAKPIRIVVPSPAGSPIDAVARKLGDSLSRRLAVTVLVDNKPGAAGSIGAAEVARAAADGYTLLFTVNDPLVGVLATMASLPYDPLKDFSFITKVAVSGPVLAAHPSVKANNLSELVAEIKAGARHNYGSWGPGSLPMQVMESFAQQAGIKITEVSYRGGPPALQDLLAGQIQSTFLAPHLAPPLIADGKIKVIALVGKKRSTLLPNTQTFAEAGFNSFIFTNEIWVGLTAPAKLDRSIQDQLANAVRASLQEPELHKFLIDIGFAIVAKTPDEFAKEHQAEVAVVPGLIRKLGVTPQ